MLAFSCELSCKSEVCQLDLTLLVDEDVIALQVSMHLVLHVEEIESQ